MVRKAFFFSIHCILELSANYLEAIAQQMRVMNVRNMEIKRECKHNFGNDKLHNEQGYKWVIGYKCMTIVLRQSIR